MGPAPEPVDPEVLRGLATRVLGSLLVPDADARLVADTLVQADLWGHASHGVLRLPWYAARLRQGVMAPVTRIETLVDLGALVLVDGHDGVGQVLADHARAVAVERARAHGVGLVGVRRSGHFGTAMYYTRAAARQGCVAFLATNASPAMAPWGAREKVVGTNPWSIAAPAPVAAAPGGVVAVDVANTAVARGKVYLARSQGEPIPDTWVLGADGLPTTDAAEAVHGILQPMAGAKGYAIAFLMDVLAGALTGSAVGRGVHGPYELDQVSGCGHLFLAVDVGAFGPVSGYEDRVADLIGQVKAADRAPGVEEVLYPGELEDRAERAALAAGGVPVAADTRAELAGLAKECGVTGFG